ncbi:transcription factor GTE12-like [Glycine soja]|uniref:transcription factor GTE12 n=1 Tax=Glycine max TaxID=3847 RepID=UPI00071919B4|nr:transcription factor GTE12 [Glycine max]XP_028206532.1 transcription factor GTE12-like [Glycine soja]|eukprot:XP_014624283.1 transcription factor GTE12 [Glycine max]
MSRLRKLQKTEGQRRSPRISALEAEAHVHSMRRHLDNGQGPAFRTRGRKNTKLRPNKGVKHSCHQDIQKKSGDDKPSKLPSSPSLPEKQILQLVLDTLQRRDTYEIFAEPVDPNEVEDYYAIVKEPMDFGTMRAKLHEGMYRSLEQFEVYSLYFIYAHVHDVFLIFDNAMHFNSSGTIYFRQARVINELAKKVFDLLKNNPEKFELEFSETRRKVGRRNQGDSRDSTDLKSSEIASGVPSKTVPCSSRGTPNKRSFKANHGSKHVEITAGKLLCRSSEIDRRCTYRPLSLEEDKSIFSTVYGKLKLLEHVNQQDIGYKDSLMLFAKDLGPTAQNIAKRKLLGCEIRTASTSAPCRPDTSNGREKVEGTLNAEREKDCRPLDGNALGCHRLSLGCHKEFPNKSFCFDSSYLQACAEDFTYSDQGSKETGKKSVRMLLDRSKLLNQENLSVSVLENFKAGSVVNSRLENSCELQSQPQAIESSDVSGYVQEKSQLQNNFMFRSNCAMGDREGTNEISCSADQAMKILKSDQTVSSASSFVFNLPYLKTRLDQINSSE